MAGVLAGLAGLGVIGAVVWFNLTHSPIEVDKDTLCPKTGSWSTTVVLTDVSDPLPKVAQEDVKKLVAYSSVSHLGFCVLGLFALNAQGIEGSIYAMVSHGLTTSVNTQITAPVIPQLRELMNLFIEAGAKNWQIQLTVAMGRAADNPELLLQPYELLELMPLIAELYREGVGRGFLIQPGNNIGYFGPYESVWRGSGRPRRTASRSCCWRTSTAPST